MRAHSDEPWEELDRTETVDNNLNPNWVKHFDISYQFHKNKQIRFEVLDEDDSGSHDLIGYYDTTLAAIMMAPKQTVHATLKTEKKANRGLLIIRADQVYDCVDEAKLAFTGVIKSNRFLCYGSDNPYILIERARSLENNDLSFETKKEKLKGSWGDKVDDLANVTDWVRVHKTNYMFDTCTPMWDPFSIRMSTLCNNNKKLPLRISVHSFKNFGTHYCYGSVITSLREIEMGRETL